MKKRVITTVILVWITSLFLTSLVGAYFFVEFQKEKSANAVYASIYNSLLENYTNLLQSYAKLLNDYNSLAQKYESEKQNLTNLLQKYESCVMHVNICIDYGNGTIRWYNNTVVPLGCNCWKRRKE